MKKNQSINYQSASIEELGKELKATRKQVNKRLVLVSLIIIIFLGIGTLFYANKFQNDKFIDDIIEKILSVGLVVFIIELILHWLFEGLNLLKIQLLISKELYGNQLITGTTLREKSEEITNNLNNTSIVLTQKSAEILTQLKQNITANKEINDSGIRGLKAFKSTIEFLKESLENYRKNNIENKGTPNLITVRLLMLFIGELQEKYHDGQHQREEFESLIKELVASNNYIEILLPNYKNAQMCEFLKLRGKSFNAHDRIKQVKNTCDNLIRLKESDQIFDKLTLKFHEEFIGFPLWSYNKIWYQGSYFCSNYAENTKYIEYSSETSINEIGKKLELHFDAISKNCLSLEAFKAYQPYLSYNAGEFFNSLFAPQKEENLNLSFSEGKSYSFFTHAAYKETKGSTKNHTHYLSKSIIKITGGFKDNCYKATLHVKTLENGKEVDLTYVGVITIDKLSSNLFMIFNAKDTEVATPVTISGNIPDSKNKELLILHHTFKSHQRKSTTTNIGILSLSENDREELPGLQDIRVGEQIDVDPKQLLTNQAKLFLMRKYKVSLKTPKFLNERNEVTEIYNKEQIQKFFHIHYKGLEGHAGKYCLYYSKSNIVAPKELSDYGKANLTIFDNGIVDLSLVTVNENGEENFEFYFGDMNFQQTDISSPVVSIKFIRSVKQKDTVLGAPTCYRELFLVLFWDRSESSKHFEITRGILLGDRDKNLGNNQQWRDNLPLIESNQCVLVSKEQFEKQPNQLGLLERALKRESKIKLTSEHNITLNEDNRAFIVIQYNDDLYKFEHVLQNDIIKKTVDSPTDYPSIH